MNAIKLTFTLVGILLLQKVHAQVFITPNSKTVIGSSSTNWNPSGNITLDKTVHINCIPAWSGFYFESQGTSPLFRPQWGYDGFLGTSNSPFVRIYVRDVVSTNAYSLSDERLKSKIAPLNSGISTIMKFKPVSYNLDYSYYTDLKADRIAALNRDGENQIGLLAQDVQEVLPQLVTELDNGLFAVDYVSMIPMLIKAIQEQQALIEDLQKQLDK